MHEDSSSAISELPSLKPFGSARAFDVRESRLGSASSDAREGDEGGRLDAAANVTASAIEHRRSTSSATSLASAPLALSDVLPVESARDRELSSETTIRVATLLDWAMMNRFVGTLKLVRCGNDAYI